MILSCKTSYVHAQTPPPGQRLKDSMSTKLGRKLLRSSRPINCYPVLGTLLIYMENLYVSTTALTCMFSIYLNNEVISSSSIESEQQASPHKWCILDNKCSEITKTLIKQHWTLEILPPHCHRRNVAEVAFQAFKQHLSSIIASVEKYFTMHQW